MPCRYIREEYLTSERVDALDVSSERFYFRLFLVVDDFGRFEANEKLLKSKIFPLKDDIRSTDVSRWLAACEKAGLIVLYTVDNKRYLSIERFSQTRANCRSNRSKYPEPPALANNLQATCNNLQALAAESESESESDNESEITARTHAQGNSYPATVGDVIAIAKVKRVNMNIDQAKKYLLTRQRADWMIHGKGKSYKLPVVGIPQDIELWCNNDRISNVQKNQSAAACRRDLVNQNTGW